MRYRSALICALFAIAAPATASTKATHLSLDLFANNGCPFFASAESDPNWSDVKVVKVKGVMNVRRGDSLVESYPEEIRLHITYGSAYDGVQFSKPAPNCTESLDAAHFQFSASWKNQSRTVPAHGSLLNAEWHPPTPWCELRCHDWWTYEIRLESANIPITDELLVTVHTPDGKLVSTLVGHLEPVERKATPTAPSP
jgi:hypothetical protein